MNRALSIITSLITFISGCLLFCIMNEWIIITIPQQHIAPDHLQAQLTQSKTTYFAFWHKKRWYYETEKIVWSSDMAETVRIIVTRLLSIMHEEGALAQNVSLESVTLSEHGDVGYISFSANPLAKNKSTHEQLLFIKSLRETLLLNKLPLKGIMLLEHHKPLQTRSLDFSKPWPLALLETI